MQWTLGSVLLVLVFFLLFVLLLGVGTLFVCKLTVRLIYDGSVRMIVRLGVLPFDVTRFLSRPKKKKKPVLFHYTGETAFGELPKKKTPSKSSKQTAVKPSAKKTTSQKEKTDVLETVGYFTGLAQEVSEQFVSHARLRVRSLYVTAASTEAAETAILFGKLNAAFSILLHTLSRFRFFDTKKARIGVYSDFEAQQPSVYADIELSARGFRLAGEILYILKNSKVH